MIILCSLLISLFFSSAIFFLEMESNISLNLNIKQYIKCYLINKNVDKYGELFINDKNLNVRCEIAENGNQKYRKNLIKMQNHLHQLNYFVKITKKRQIQIFTKFQIMKKHHM